MSCFFYIMRVKRFLLKCKIAPCNFFVALYNGLTTKAKEVNTC
ncbi:hypothetical protein [Staphylococcus phage PT94]